MAEITPFSGIRYDMRVVPDLNRVVAPPYDVIDEGQARDLQSKSSYNIAHVTRPLGADPYAQAAKLWNEWLSAGVLKADSEPSLYVYQQKFADPDMGAVMPERQALICAMKLEDYASGKVLPHENTLWAARADRLNLMRTTHANLDSHHGLYSDPDREVESFVQEYADREVTIEQVDQIIGSSHRVERISDPSATAAVAAMLADKPVFIADGHHRYETALAYQKEHPEIAGAGYILIALTAFEDEGVLVLPTHRLLKGFSEIEIESLPTKIAQAGFRVTAANGAAEMPVPWDGNRFTLLLSHGRSYDVRLPAGTDIDRMVPGSQSRAWKSLDVTVLHVLVLDKLLGISLKDLATTDNLAYTRDAVAAREMVNSGGAQAAFLMARPSVTEIKEVSLAQEMMPQKSTFFFPKLLSGPGNARFTDRDRELIRPPRLREGDTVAVLSPSWGGPSRYPAAYELGLTNLCELCGVKVKEYPTARADSDWLAGNPQARAMDLNRAFADNDVNAIIASIGGEDSVRILPDLDIESILAHPKILMGYSDTTTILSYLNQRGIVTFNGPSIMGGFTCLRSVEPAFREHIRDVLMRAAPTHEYKPYARYVTEFQDWGSADYRAEVALAPHEGWRWLQGEGMATGRLFGGNIEVLEFLKGTEFWPHRDFWQGRVLFLETSEEKPSPSNVRYMLRNYGMQGIFDKIGALLFARAYKYDEEEKRDLERQILRVVRDEFGRKDLPIVANMDFGHDMPQLIMPNGVMAEVDCASQTVRLTEPAVE